MMDASAIATIGATVMALTQIAKRALPGCSKGPYWAAGLSLLAVLLYVSSAPVFPPGRLDIWPIFAGWVSVYATSMGLYGVSQIRTGP